MYIVRGKSNEKRNIYLFLKEGNQQFKADTYYGFYYTKFNKPIGFEGIIPYDEEDISSWFGLHYKYRTEPIIDNWWFFEMKMYL